MLIHIKFGDIKDVPHYKFNFREVHKSTASLLLMTLIGLDFTTKFAASPNFMGLTGSWLPDHSSPLQALK